MSETVRTRFHPDVDSRMEYNNYPIRPKFSGIDSFGNCRDNDNHGTGSAIVREFLWLEVFLGVGISENP